MKIMIKKYNNFFTDEILETIHRHLDSPLTTWINQKSTGANDENSFGMYEVSHFKFFNTDLLNYINDKIHSNFLLERVYFNRQDTNQHGSFHQDHLHGYTLLTYMNKDFQESWGGETVFKPDNEKVLPFYNSSVLFKGSIFHKGNAFNTKNAPKRISLAFKLIPKEIRLTKEEVKQMAVKFSNDEPPKSESATNIRVEYDQHGNEIITHVGDDGESIKTEVKLSDNGAVDTTVGTTTVSDDEKMQMELVSMPTLVLAKINFHPDIVEEINNHIDDVVIPKNKSNADKLVGQYNQDEKSAQLVFDFESDVGELLKNIFNRVGTAYLRQGYNRQSVADVQQAWTNHGFSGDYNPYHDHPFMGVYPNGHQCTAALSGFLWLKIPEQISVLEEMPDTITDANGKINGFTHLAWGHHTVHDLKKLKFVTEKYLKPKEGEMWIFPNWLKHQVYPFFGEGERRSMAMNWAVYDSEDELKRYMNEDQIKAFEEHKKNNGGEHPEGYQE